MEVAGMKLKGKTLVTIIIPLFIIVVGINMNFQETLMGGPATNKNLIVTFLYLTIWILVLIMSIKNKIRKVMFIILYFG